MSRSSRDAKVEVRAAVDKPNKDKFGKDKSGGKDKPGNDKPGKDKASKASADKDRKGKAKAGKAGKANGITGGRGNGTDKPKGRGKRSSRRLRPVKPKSKCCQSRPRCRRCPIRLLHEGRLPTGYAVRHRRLVRL